MSNASTIKYSSGAGVDWAALLAGKDGAKWFGLPDLVSYSAWVVNRNENTAWSVNE